MWQGRPQGAAAREGTTTAMSALSVTVGGDWTFGANFGTDCSSRYARLALVDKLWRQMPLFAQHTVACSIANKNSKSPSRGTTKKGGA